MSERESSKSYARARELIERIAAQAAAQGDARLPTVSALAKMASVRSATMCRALADLESQGIIQTRQRTGTRLHKAGDLRSDTTDQDPPDTWQELKWKAVYNRMKSDIITGHYRISSVLPPPKELCERYGVVYRTLRKALDRLTNDRMVAPYRRTYRIAVPILTAARRTLVLVARGDGDRHIMLDWELQAERYRLLETECAQAGIRLVTATGYYLEDKLCGLDEIEEVMNDPLLRPSILGYLVWGNALPDTFTESVLDFAAGTRLPVSILDYRARPESRELAGGNVRAKTFGTGSDTDPGRQLARHLLSLGHRRVAYLYPEPAGLWAQNRLRGMQEELALLGGAVTPILVREASFYEIALANPLNAGTVLNAVMRHYLPDRAATDLVPVRIREAFASQVDQSVQGQLYYDAMHPLLESVVAHGDITALVGASDAIAAVCMDFLHLKGVPVPQRFSVAGFGDSSEATRLHLTSFNFNSPACIQAMLNHILHPTRRMKAGAADRTTVEIRGFVTARSSTGKAPGA